jgi:hypothetical protein
MTAPPRKFKRGPDDDCNQQIDNVSQYASPKRSPEEAPRANLRANPRADENGVLFLLIADSLRQSSPSFNTEIRYSNPPFENAKILLR